MAAHDQPSAQTEVLPAIRTAVIGAGAIGRTHVTALTTLDGFRLASLTGGARAQGLADELEEHGVRRPEVRRDLECVLDDPSIDLVVIATPSGLHAEQALAALAAGKHVLLEKPVDVELSRARQLNVAASEARARGLVTAVVSQHRFDLAYRIVAETIATGGFGTVCMATASVPWWRPQSYYDGNGWRGTWSMDGGGALMNQGAHTVDLLLWLLGKPTEISARTSRRGHERIEVEDTAVATVEFDSGALATLSATTAAYPGLTTRIEIMGTSGSALVEGDQLRYFHVAADAGADPGSMGLGGGGNQASTVLGAPVPQDILVDDPTVSASGHRNQYRDLLQAIRSGVQPAVTARDGLLALATTCAAYTSAALGAPVQVDDMLAGRYDDVLKRLRERSTSPA